MINPANNIRRWLISVGLSLLWCSTSLLNCHATEVRYNVIKIIEGTGTSAPTAGGINQKGQVVGSMDTSGGSGFWLWSDGVRQDLPLGTNRNCHAVGLNNQGQVVGSFHTGEFGVDSHGIVYPLYHAFVWTAGSLQDLGTFGGEVSFGSWINDQGVVLGAADTADDRIPFIARDGQMRSLLSLIVNPSGWKLALETHYVAADGRIWGLGTYGGKEHIYQMTPEGSEGMYRIKSRGILQGLTLAVYGFNEYGQAVGFTFSSEGGGAFLWDEQGMKLLGDLGQPGSYAYAINNLAQVVGMSLNSSGSYNALLWENGVIFNLNDLIPSDSGIVLTQARANAINDAGNIVCTYRNVASGFYGICLLVPVNPMPLEITRNQLTQGGLSLEVCGGGGQPLAVEYTSDFVQWTTLATSTSLIGRRSFIDPTKDSNFRAYRARLLTPLKPSTGARTALSASSAFRADKLSALRNNSSRKTTKR